MSRQRIYVELDAILDTRLSTLSSIDPSLYSKLIKNEDYHHRRSDIWKDIGLDIDQEEYDKRYANRGGDILKDSVITNMILMLKDIAINLIEHVTLDPHLDAIDLTLNTYPYEMSEDVTKSILGTLAETLGREINYSAVHYSPLQVLPQYIDTKFDLVIMYHFKEWVDLHYKGLIDNKLVTIQFYAPSLYKESVDEDEMREIIKESLGDENISSFGVLEMELAPLLMLKCLPVKLFTIIDPNIILSEIISANKAEKKEG